VNNLPKTTKIAVFSEEYGGGLKRYLCLGTHVWSRMYVAHTKEKVDNEEYHQEIIIYKCKDCGRRWILVTVWKEWEDEN